MRFFPWWSGRTAQAHLGLCLGDDAVTAVELYGPFGGPWQCRAAAVPWSGAAVGTEAPGPALTHVLRDVLGAWQPRTWQVNVVWPSAPLVRKQWPLPAGMDDYELEQHLQAEATHYVGLPWDQVLADFHRLPVVADGAESARWELYAVPRARVQRVWEALEQAGLDVQCWEPASHALWRCIACAGQAAPEVVAVELGASQVTLVWMAAYGSVQSHTVAVRAESEALWPPLPVNALGGEEHAPEPSSWQAVQQGLEWLSGLRPQRLLLHGAQFDAHDAGLVQRTGIPVDALAVPSGIEWPASLRFADGALACGAALRGLV